MNTKGKRALLVILSIIIGVFLTFSSVIAQEAMNSIIEGAKKEGKLVWYYAGAIETAYKIINKFKMKYPFLDAQFIKGTRPEITARFETETKLQKHIADVLLVGGSETYLFKKKGFLRKYIPEESKFFTPERKDPEGFWVSVYSNLEMPAYNTNRVSSQDLPKNIYDLLDPKWKGEIVTDTGKIYRFLPLLQLLGEEKGIEYLKKLASQIVPRSGDTLAISLLAAGEYKLIFAVPTKIVDRELKKGIPAAPAFLDYIRESYFPTFISINAPHPNAAKLFVEYNLSEEGQTIWADEPNYPCRRGVKIIGPTLGKAANLIENKQVKVIPEKIDWIDDANRYQKIFNDIFRKR